jgi:hypothetical protein
MVAKAAHSLAAKPGHDQFVDLAQDVRRRDFSRRANDGGPQNL